MKLQDIKDRCEIDDDHWLWKGAASSGVPRIWAPDYTARGGEKSAQTGRRAVWHVKHGKAIPNGWRIFAGCDEPMCVAPKHTRCLAPAEEGAAVAASGKWKGRITRITANRAIGRRRSKLTPELVALILSSPKSGSALGRELNLGRSLISKVRTRKTLSHEAVGGLFTGLMAMNDTSQRQLA